MRYEAIFKAALRAVEIGRRKFSKCMEQMVVVRLQSPYQDECFTSWEDTEFRPYYMHEDEIIMEYSMTV